MDPLPWAEAMKFMTPSDLFWAICRPCLGKYSVNVALPWLNGVHTSGNWSARYVVNCAVEPDPSECTTGVIGNEGSAWPLLSAVIAGSFQFVIWLVKIRAMVRPDSRRSCFRTPPTLTLYGNDVPPATIGR